NVTAGIGVSSAGFQVHANLNFSIGVSGIDLRFTAVADMNISKTGFSMFANVSLNADVTSLLHLKASGLLIITPNTFLLSLNGGLTIAQVLTINGSFLIDVGAGGANPWRSGMNLSGSLGPITVTAGGYIQSDGQFSISVGGNLSFGITDFGISGYVSGTVSLKKYNSLGQPLFNDYSFDPSDIYTLTVQVGG